MMSMIASGRCVARGGTAAGMGPRPPVGPGEPRVWPVPGPLLPGDAPFTIDCNHQTYGLAKEGARHSTGQRGYHPLLAVAAGTGDVLMARASPLQLLQHTAPACGPNRCPFYTHGVVSVSCYARNIICIQFASFKWIQGRFIPSNESAMAGRLTRQGPPPHFASAPALALGTQFSSTGSLRSLPLPS